MTLRSATLLLALAAWPAGAAEVQFHLVAQADWEAGRLDPEHYLPVGEVFLYRLGSYEPEIVAPLNEPLAVPPGEWTWVAEAPGFVSIQAGAFAVTEEESPAKALVWEGIPACQVTVSALLDFRRLDRLDVVSLPHGAAFPLVPKVKERAWVPAGRFLTYGVTRGGLTGVSAIRSCAASESVAVAPPPPPAVGRQALLWSSSFSEPLDRSPLSIALVAARQGSALATTLPSAVTWSAGRVTAFFIDAPASEALWLDLAHPALRSERRLLEPRSGEAWEVPTAALRERVDLTFDLDYRPRREHHRAELVLYRCGAQRARSPNLEHQGCLEVGARKRLKPGLHSATFPALDTGQYLIDALIDDERVRGLGNYLQPYLGPEATEFTPQGPAWLWEMEVYGEITLEGDPVEGWVRLETPDSGTSPHRDFPTGDDGLYRLFYFATVANRFDLGSSGLPLELLERPEDERMGLFSRRNHLQACSAEGFCKVFHITSSLLGEGRLDLEIGPETQLSVTVRNDETEEALEGVLVSYRPAAKALRFVHGRQHLEDAVDAHATGAFTDSTGRVQLQGLAEGNVDLTLLKDGFRPAARSLSIRASEGHEVEVGLVPDRRDAGTELVLADGSPASRAAVLVYDQDQRWNRSCSRGANGAGRVELPEACSENTHALVLHPRATTIRLPINQLRQSGSVHLPPTPLQPTLVKVVNSQGQPVAGVALEIEIDGLPLSPNAQVFAASRHGPSSYAITAADGSVVLRGIDPIASTVTLRAAGSEEAIPPGVHQVVLKIADGP
ncbi:MAG: hypothetical protein AAF604_11720 [Acidobacteriota bacterium]